MMYRYQAVRVIGNRPIYTVIDYDTGTTCMCVKEDLPEGCYISHVYNPNISYFGRYWGMLVPFFNKSGRMWAFENRFIPSDERIIVFRDVFNPADFYYSIEQGTGYVFLSLCYSKDTDVYCLRNDGFWLDDRGVPYRYKSARDIMFM